MEEKELTKRKSLGRHLRYADDPQVAKTVIEFKLRLLQSAMIVGTSSGETKINNQELLRFWYSYWTKRIQYPSEVELYGRYSVLKSLIALRKVYLEFKL